MTSVTMNLELLSEQHTFSPGETLKGVINLSLAHPVVLNRITVKLCGICILNQMHKDPERIVTRAEIYVNEKKCLYNSKEKNTETLYSEAGNHVFSFTFQLPDNIPSSFESKEGYVRYYIKSSLEGLNLPLILEKNFISVNALLDLNAIPKSQYPSTAVIDKRNHTWCCSKTKLHAAVHIPRRGYVPGEVIVFNAEINNLDSKPVVSVKAQLMQIVTFHHKKRPSKMKRKVSEVTRGYILPNESQYWMDETIVIPSLVSSYLKHCSLIDVKYKIYFRIAKSGMPEIVMKLPIIIGNMPLMGCIDVLAERLETEQHSVSTLERANRNYEPCFFGPHDVTEPNNKNFQEKHMFSPKYTVYSS